MSKVLAGLVSSEAFLLGHLLTVSSHGPASARVYLMTLCVSSPSFLKFTLACTGSSLGLLCEGFLQLHTRRGYSSFGCTGFSLWWPLLHRLQAGGLQQVQHASFIVGARRLQSVGSVVVAYGPSCSKACGIFQEQGLNLCLLQWQANSDLMCHQ